MISKISNYITDNIYATLPGVEPEKREIIEYGAYMFISEVSKITLLLLIAAIFKVQMYVVAIILIFGFLRMPLGGVHAKTHWACLISYFSFIYGILLASIYTSPDRLIVDLIVIPYAYIISYLYAPADMPVKPVVSKKQRKRLRIIGFILLTVLFSVSQFLNQFWFNIIMFTCLLQITLMTPLVYRITGNKYGREEVGV